MNLTPAQLDLQRIEREQRREKFINENRKAWAKNGKKHRGMRIAYRITLREMSSLTGFSASKLGDFELGNPIHNRAVIEKSYNLVFRLTGAMLEKLTDSLRV
jgi:hypothetical protein